MKPQSKIRQKERPVFKREKPRIKPEKPWLLEYKWTNKLHKARYQHEKPEVWYHGAWKKLYLSPQHALKEMNKEMRTGNQNFNDHVYGGRRWQVRHVNSGEIAGIVIINNEALLDQLSS